MQENGLYICIPHPQKKWDLASWSGTDGCGCCRRPWQVLCLDSYGVSEGRVAWDCNPCFNESLIIEW